MMRASFSPLLSLSADLSCSILDHKGDVVAQGNDIPVHLGAMPFSAKGVLAAFPLETWRPGDAVLNNDPYSGGSHLPDMTLLTPIFDADGVVGFAASRVHWPDIGGSSAGSSSVTDEIVKEGLRVPPVKIMREGQPDDGVWTLLFANVRIPDDRVGDFRAQAACNARGVERVEEVIARYGGPAVRQIFVETQDYSQRMVEAVLDDIPDGTYRATQHLDGDGYSEDTGNGTSGSLSQLKGRRLRFDFAGTGRQARGPVGAPFMTASVCYYTILALAGGAVPPNSGAYRPVEISAPEGSWSIRSILHRSWPLIRKPLTASLMCSSKRSLRPFPAVRLPAVMAARACLRLAVSIRNAAGVSCIWRQSVGEWARRRKDRASTGTECIWETP